MRGWLDDQHWRFLGAPAERGDYRHAQAGRLEDGCRVDCWLKLDGERLEAVSFEVFGSPEALGMAGWLGGWLQGASVAQARSVSALWLATETAVSPEARSEAIVIEDALFAAMTAGKGKGGGC